MEGLKVVEKDYRKKSFLDWLDENKDNKKRIKAIDFFIKEERALGNSSLTVVLKKADALPLSYYLKNKKYEIDFHYSNMFKKVPSKVWWRRLLRINDSSRLYMFVEWGK